MKTAKLHQLITMAQAGKKFRANIVSNRYRHNQEVFIKNDCSWRAESITADWQYEEIVEPMVIWVNMYAARPPISYMDEKDANEFRQEGGTTKKFVEVMGE